MRTHKITVDEEEFIIQILNHHKETLPDIEKTEITRKNVQIQPLTGGSVSLNYKISLPHGITLFMKRQIKNSEFYSNPLEREYLTLLWLAPFNVTPHPYFFDKEQRVLAVEFLRTPPVDRKKNPLTRSIIPSLSVLFSTLHTAPLPLIKELYSGSRITPKRFWFDFVRPRINALEKNCLVGESGSTILFPYLQEIEYFLTSYLEKQDDVHLSWNEIEESRPFWLNLLHNDFASRNILWNAQTQDFYVVDWEYADVGHIAFDLAYFMNEDLLSRDFIRSIIEKLPYTTYRDQIQILKQIDMFRPLIDFANAYAVMCRYISSSPLHNMQESQYSSHILRTPYSLGYDIAYAMNRLRSLARYSSIHPDDTTLMAEVQRTLNLFKTQLFLL